MAGVLVPTKQRLPWLLGSPEEWVIRTPDDFHCHFRDGQDKLRVTVAHTSAQFGRAIAMPNLTPPVRSVLDAMRYRDRLMDVHRQLQSQSQSQSNDHHSFTPLMTLYLTDETTPEMISEAAKSGIIQACKLYPKNATTNSENGVSDLDLIAPALRRMADEGLLLLVHGEVTDIPDPFDRESAFLDRVFPRLLKIAGPKLKIILEHISTEKAARMIWNDESGRLAGTITAHHLLCTRSDIFESGRVRPHLYCLPILKCDSDRVALIKAATSGDPRFFAGTDSAPHTRVTKECCMGRAGVYTAHCAVECYAQVFADEECMHHLESFLSENGARFYGLPLNRGSLTLSKQFSQVIPESFAFADHGQSLIPFKAGQCLDWTVIARE